MTEAKLLELDGVGNILLGLPLLLFPSGVAAWLGLPFGDSAFYPVILGSVFLGIGFALLVERFSDRMTGLGLGGALTINITFGTVLACWLIWSGAQVPTHALVLLWTLASILVGLGSLEWFSVMNRPRAG